MSASSRAVSSLVGDHEYGAGGDRGFVGSSDAAQVDVDYLILVDRRRHRGRRDPLVVGLTKLAVDKLPKFPAFSCHRFGTLHTPFR